MSFVCDTRAPLAAMLLALITLSTACSDNDPESLMLKAQAAQEAGEYREAAIYLKNILRIDPDDVAARIELGMVSLELDAYAEAEKEFRAALELGAELDPIRVSLGTAMLNQGKAREVLEYLGTEEAADDTPDADLLLLRGRALFALGEFEKARSALEEAIAAAPDSGDAYTELARLYIAEGRIAEAQAPIEKALELDSANAPSLLVHGVYHAISGRYDEAEAAFRSVLDVESNAQSRVTYNRALVHLVELHLEQGNLETADELADELLAQDEGVYARFLGARVAAESGNAKAAIQSLLNILRDAPGFQPAERLLGALYASQGNYLQAEMHLERVLAWNAGDEFARRMLAEISLAQNEPDKAMRILRPALGESGGANAELLQLAGRASLMSGQQADALQFFQASISANPDDVELRLKTAVTLVIAGNVEPALALLENIPASTDTDLASRAIRIIAAVRDARIEEALAAAESLAGDLPAESWPHNLLGAIHLAKNDTAAARTAFETASRIDPDDLGTMRNLARVDLAEGRLGDAKSRYGAVLEKDEGNYEALMSLARLELGDNGDRERARDHLLRARAANPRAVDPMLLLAGMHLSDGATSEALSLARDVLKTMPNNARAHNLIGLAQLQDTNIDGAVRSFEEATRLDPNEAHYYLNLAQAHSARRRTDKVLDAILDAVTANPGQAIPFTLLENMQLEPAHQAMAAELLKAASRENAGSFETLFFEGMLRTSQGRSSEAANAYLRAFDTKPALLPAVRVFMSRRAAGLPDATAALQAWVAANPSDANARFSLAAATQELGDTDGAIREYESVLAIDPRHAFSLNNLAVLYHETGDGRALSLAERAYDVARDHPAILDTYGWLQTENGNVDRGVTLLEAAAARSDSPDIQYHLAAAYARLDRPGDAARILEPLIKSGADFSNRSEAEALLREL